MQQIFFLSLMALFNVFVLTKREPSLREAKNIIIIKIKIKMKKAKSYIKPVKLNNHVSHEKNFPPSQTIPNEAYTIRQLLDDHTRGIMPQVKHQGLYEEEPDLDNPPLNKQPDYDLEDRRQQEKYINDTIAASKAGSKKQKLESGASENKLNSEAAKPIEQGGANTTKGSEASLASEASKAGE